MEDSKIQTSTPIDWDVLHSTIRKMEQDNNYWLCSYMLLSAYTGLRVSDVTRITWSMILSGKDYFDIQEKKTKKNRRIHLNHFLVDSIKKYYAKQGVINPKSVIVCNKRGN